MLRTLIPIVSISIASATSIYTLPYPNGSYDGGEFIENTPTVELPIQSTYANGKYKYAVFREPFC